MPARAAAIATAALLTSLMTFALGACGDKTSTDTGNLRTPAERGERIAAESGCQACHGRNWEGGIAPTFIGLAGSTVTLQDGTTVLADTAFLTRSITDPSAEKSGTSTMVMPPNQLTADQVADIVAFIESLGQG
jgi:cytochrome c oxidase subunit 2